MKKFISFMLALTVVFSTMVIMPSGVSAESGLLVSDDFESGFDNNKWNASNTNNVTVADGVAKVYGGQDSSQGIGVKLTDAITSGTVNVKFDLLVPSINTGSWEMHLFGGTAATDANFILFLDNSSLRIAGAGYTLCTPERNRWYTVDVTFVCESQEAIVTATDHETGHIYRTEATLKEAMKSNLQFYIGTKWMETAKGAEEYVLIDNFSVSQFDRNKPIAEDVFVDFSQEEPGNNFFPERGDKIGLKFLNMNNTPEEKRFEYVIRNDLDEIIYSGEETFKFEGGEAKEVDLMDKVTKFGTYKLDVSTYDTEGNLIATKKDFFSLSPYTPDDDKNSYFGLGYHTDRTDNQEYIFDLFDATGTGLMRVDCRWDLNEPQPGNRKVYDRLLKTAEFCAQNDIEVLHVINGRHNTHTGGTLPTTPEKLAKYEDYCAWLAGELKGKIKYFEALNEINYSVNEKEFFEIQKATYNGIKRGNPDAIVVGFCMAGIHAEYTENVFKMGGLDYMDEISYHHYQNYGMPEEPDIHGEMMVPIHDLLKKYGKPDMPVWMTEIGWITYNHVTQSRTERQVGSYLIRMTSLFRAKDTFDRMFWYEFQNAGYSLTAQESCFGVIKAMNGSGESNPYIAKIAYVTACAMNKLIGDAPCVDYKELDDKSTYVTKYKLDDGKDALILWTTKKKRNLNLKLGAQTGELYDMLGNKLCDLSSIDGTFSFVLSGEPVYLIGDFPEFEVDETGGIVFDKTYSESVKGDINEFTLTKSTDAAMNIDVKPMPGVDMVENNGFNGNTAKIKLTLNDDALIIDETNQFYDREATRVRLSVTGGDKTYLVGELQCFANRVIEAEFGATEMYQGSYLNRWLGAASITNKSVQKSVGGKFKITSPDYLADYVGEIEFDNIAPGETHLIKFNFPEMVEKEIIPVTAKIELTNGYTTEISKKMNFIYATYAHEKPVIDGVLTPGEWTTGIMRTEKAVQLPTGYPLFHVNWKGPHDLSANYGMMWDEEYCYMYGKIKDDIHFQNQKDGGAWMGDSIQLGVTDQVILNWDNVVNLVGSVGVSYGKFTELTFALTDDGPIIYRNKSISGKPVARLKNVDVNIKRQSGETIYEVKVPWEEIITPDRELKVNDVISMSLLVNENDGSGRAGYIEYASGIARTKDSREFGSIILIDK